MPSALTSLYSIILVLISFFFLLAPSPVFAQEQCPDDLYYFEEPNKCVHKSGGSYDEAAQKCEYNFATMTPISEPECAAIQEFASQPISTPTPGSTTGSPAQPGAGTTTPSTTPTPSSSSPSAALLGVTPNEWSGGAQVTWSLDLVLCSIGELGFGFCPYGYKQPAHMAMADGQIKLAMKNTTTPTGGALASVVNVTGLLYSPPTSTVQYLADIGKNFGFATPVYAQAFGVPGSGASIIEPVKAIWQVMRNLAYLAFILIFLMVGFMIMFKQKISQQAVVTAQMALPGLIVGLILVTFSYFLAALVIDLAFVGIPLVTNVFSQTGLSNTFGSPDQLQNIAQDSSVFQLFGMTAARFPSNIGEVWGQVDNTLFGSGAGAYMGIGSLFGAIVGSIAGGFLGGPLGVAIGAGIGGGTGSVLGAPVITGIISLLLPIILLVALLFQMVRLLFALISTYIQLLVATITGPLIILAGSIPGRGGATGGWLKTLIGNALVFPAVFAAFLFAGIILAMPSSAWQASPPLFGGLSIRLLQTLLAYGIILATPGIPDAVRGAFGIKPQQGGLVGAATAGFMSGIAGSQMLGNAARGGVQLGYRRGIFDRPLEGARRINMFGRRPFRQLPEPIAPRVNA